MLRRAALSSPRSAHPNIGLRAEADGDLSAGRVDDRLLAVVLIVATTNPPRRSGALRHRPLDYVARADRVFNHALGAPSTSR